MTTVSAARPSAVFRRLLLISDDALLAEAVRVMAADRDLAETVAVVSAADLPRAATDVAADGVIVDADGGGDGAAIAATLRLIQTAPVFVLGRSVTADAEATATFARIGVAGVFAKESGAAAPGLAGSEGRRLASALRAACASRGSLRGMPHG